MEEKVLTILSEVSGVPRDQISLDSRLLGDMGITSFDLADIVVTVEEEYGVQIPDERFRELETVSDILCVLGEESAE